MRITLLLFLLITPALSRICLGQIGDSVIKKCFLKPDLVKLQFAGNIGFFSIGAGYYYSKEKMELDFLYGFVPRSLGGPLHSVTLKNTWTPFRSENLGSGFDADLLTIGIPLTYTFGKQFFFLAPRDQYPARYYDYSSALRIGIFAGGRVKKNLSKAYCFKQVSLYYEIGTYDLLIHNYYYNIGTSPVTDLFNLGIGIQARL